MLFEKGKTALEQEDAEMASLLFHQAQSSAAKKPEDKLNASVLTIIEDAMKSADPLYEVQRTVRSRVGKILLGIAKRYHKKRWVFTARHSIDEAMRIDPAKASKAVRATMEAKKREDLATEMARHLPSLGKPGKYTPWTKEGSIYVAPWAGKSEISILLSPEMTLVPGYRLEVEMRFVDKLDQAGVAFAFNKNEDYLVVNASYSPEGVRWIRLLKPIDGGLKHKTMVDVANQPDWKDKFAWFNLIIEVRQEEVSIGVEGFPLKVIPLPGRNLTGRIGLAAVSGSQTGKQIRFRSFKLRRMTP